MLNVLYHGSSVKVDLLTPYQASDWLSALGNLKGVYATSNRDLALAFALGAIPDENGSVSRYIKHKKHKPIKMVYLLGKPNFGGKGYLYVLKKEKFRHLEGFVWISEVSVKPIEIVEIDVNDYLYLFRYATQKEKEEIQNNKKYNTL